MENITLSEQIKEEKKKLDNIVLRAVKEYSDKTGLMISKIELTTMGHSDRFEDEIFYYSELKLIIDPLL